MTVDTGPRELGNRRKAGITEATVRTHVSIIPSKLQVASRTQATLYALREGITSLNDMTETS